MISSAERPVVRALFVDNDDEFRVRYVRNLRARLKSTCGVSLDEVEASTIEDAEDLLEEHGGSFQLVVCDLLFPPLDRPDAPEEAHVPLGLQVVEVASASGCRMIVAVSRGNLDRFPFLKEDATSKGAHLFCYRGALQDPTRYGWKGLAADVCKALGLADRDPGAGETAGSIDSGSRSSAGGVHIVMEQVHVGDSYSAGQVGAQGPQSRAEGISFVQYLSGSGTSVEALVDELARLLAAMRSTALAPEHHVAVGEIAAAEESFRRGDEVSGVGHLRQAGRWALESAQSVGLAVAASGLSHALGVG